MQQCWIGACTNPQYRLVQVEVVMVVSENNSVPTTNNEGFVAFSKEVSIVGMILVGVVSPCESW